MRIQQLKISTIAVTIILCLSDTTLTSSQTATKIVVPLQLNNQYEQSSIVAWIEFENSSPALSGSSPSRLGRAPGGTVVRVEPIIDQPLAYRIGVDSNGDKDLTNDLSYVVKPDSTIDVKVSRKWKSNKEQLLPYQITYSRRVNNDGKVKETFYWRPQYCAEGRIKIKGCEALFVALDLNGDGLFDQEDFARGTTIGLDRDGDGRIWGKDEWLLGSQIMEYCGASFLIEGVEADGTALTLVPTMLRIPKLGEPLPSFSLTTVEGKTINSAELRGKVFLLEFWASWCKPCVEKFADVKELNKRYADRLEVIAINVDEKSRLQQAHEVIRRYGLSWRHVMSGQGDKDPIWKTFGGMEGNRLAIPLYVLVAPDGKLYYAGNGGTDLSELRGRLEELLPKEGSKIKLN